MNVLNDLEYRMSKEDLNTFDDDCQSDFSDEEAHQDRHYSQTKKWEMPWE